jgi:photosynthetic reaction center cytochrome c subunit
MRFRSRRTTLDAIATVAACLFGAAPPGAQAQAVQKPLLAEQVHKNIQVLRGLPEDQFMETMGFFSASLAANCTYCHVPESSGSWARYADDTQLKQTTRMMIVIMNAINHEYFAGRRVVTCWSCHRGDELPAVTPDLAEVYGVPRLTEPDEITENAPGAPSADQVLDKYIQALGGAERLANLTSFVARGTYQGYGDEKRPVEIFAKAPAERTIIVHETLGDSTRTFDGRAGWIAAPEADQPVPVLELTGGDLEGAPLQFGRGDPNAQKIDQFPSTAASALTRTPGRRN